MGNVKRSFALRINKYYYCYITTKFEIPFSMVVFGNKPMKCCTITCNSQGPVISLEPRILNFGVIQTLQTVERQVQLSNDSPIPASIITEIVSLRKKDNKHINTSNICVQQPKKSEFKLQEAYIELNPNESVPVTVSVYLCNPGKVKDVMNIILKNGATYTCTLEAEAVGTSILCEPALGDILNLGQIPTHGVFTFPIRFINKGRREHKLFWTRNKSAKSFKDPPISG